MAAQLQHTQYTLDFSSNVQCTSEWNTNCLLLLIEIIFPLPCAYLRILCLLLDCGPQCYTYAFGLFGNQLNCWGVTSLADITECAPRSTEEM